MSLRHMSILAVSVAMAAAMLMRAGLFASVNGSLQGERDPVSSAELPAPSRSHPAIAYAETMPRDAVSELNRRLQAGEVQLRMDRTFLQSVLQALNIPVESQVMVFSKTSLQSAIIGPDNPRSIFFNDSVSVAWPRGGFVELAAVDPQLGVNFYTLDQGPNGQPTFTRQTQRCLVCHVSSATLRVPGMAVGSVFPEPDGMPLPGVPPTISDHRTPLEQRWGGWYITGANRATRHMGNALVLNPDMPESMVTAESLSLTTLREKFDTNAYLLPYSDAAALMVLEHQTHLTNLLTRIGWEVRIALFDRRDLTTRMQELAREIVDYILFVDEAPLAGSIESVSGFASAFGSGGPRDARGRSLRDLDLTRRLLRYPCSYMVYSSAFDGLPREAQEAIYQRMWVVLAGQDNDPRYSRLSFENRLAIVEILRETKATLPSYFQPSDLRENR